MRRLVWLWPVLLATVGCAPTAIRGYAGAAFMKIEGQTSLDDSGGTLNLGAVRNDLEDALDVGDEDPSLYLRAEADWDAHRVTASWFDYDENGQATLANDFGDIPAGTDVNTALELWNIKGTWSYDLVPTEMFRAAPGIELNYTSMDVEVVAQPSSAFESLQVDGLVPMLFVQGEVDLGVVAGILDIAWIDLDLGDADGAYWDLEAMVRVMPVDRLEFIAGYRLLTLDLEGTADGRDFDSDTQISGFFVGGGVRF